MKGNHINVILVGAPNCGKSTLFNRLAHANVPVGNRAGVTVNQTAQLIRGVWIGKGCPDFYLTDLPGIRSLEPISADEAVTCSALSESNPDLIINVLGASSLERCLALTVNIRTSYPNIPMICAVNMCDELEKENITLSTTTLTKMIGVPFVGVSAANGNGFTALRTIIHKTLMDVAAAAADRTVCGKSAALRPAGAALPRSAAGRAAFAAHAAAASLSGNVKHHLATDRADKILTRPAFGIPFFLAVMALIFRITFGYIGNILTLLFEKITLIPLGNLFNLLAANPKCPVILGSFLSSCLLGGVGAVVSFLPRITLLFILLSLLEDSGYMARASFVMDSTLRRAGLSGRAFVPVLLGFGCSVTAIMSTRTISDRDERLRCILLLPLISCSARTPIYSIIADAFFPKYGWLAVLCVYLTGILVFLSCSCIMKAASHSTSPMFITELPRYRIPRPRVIIPTAAGRAKEFLIRAGGIIFLSTALIWLLSSITPDLKIAVSPDDSLMSLLAGFLLPVFSPLGFGNWKATAALICGIGAKEGVISALGVLTGGNITSTLALSDIYTPASALSFMIFSSMYIPCAATISIMKNETGSIKKTTTGIFIMFACAYILSFVVFNFTNNLF